ncbi:HlyD family secretion protein [Colwellia sp. Bg11-12]|uniref:HlyD family secretion protein n=1 Tax=Colwellia sp. Bg11-12 TaxID=2759817 RepID=UPI0015F74429|nr:HlyD family efflux transporter periplasmic adaptor subunit [Colwellia sp. Bg11-12]MBA6265435.1 HlyD family efflux transporter periplasmic adaptor subunit [Colwellia sp. Bg11-12]
MLTIPTDQNNKKRGLFGLAFFIGICCLLVLWQIYADNNKSDKAERLQTQAQISVIKYGQIKVNVDTYGRLKAKVRRGIIAMSQGHISDIQLRPGAKLEKGATILTLTNPKLIKAYQNSQLDLLEEQAKIEKLSAELSLAYFQQEADIELAKADLSINDVDLKANLKLRETNVVSELKLQKVIMQRNKAQTKLNIETKKLSTLTKTHQSTRKAASYRIKCAQSAVDMLKNDIDNLSITASMAGILIQLDDKLEIGQQIMAGSHLGTVVDTKSLYAELVVSASEADKIRFNQTVDLFIKGEKIVGYISRIAPTVINGSVKIDVEFKQALPNSAMPNIDVTGEVNIVNIEKTLIAKRSVLIVKPGSEQTLFVRPKGDSFFYRQQVNIGEITQDVMQILSDINIGDEILLTMPAQLSLQDKISAEHVYE